MTSSTYTTLMDFSDVSNDIDETISIDCHNHETAESCRLFLNINCRNNFKVISINIRSYQRNFDSFATTLKRFNLYFDAIVLTECWLADGTLLHPLYTDVIQ